MTNPAYCGGFPSLAGTRLARGAEAGHPVLLAGLALADIARAQPGKTKTQDYRRDGRLPARGNLLIRNAVVMTMDAQRGDIHPGDVHVRDGEIVAVGQNLRADGAEIIDGTGRIVLPGFVDTHWHLWNSVFRGLVFFFAADLGYFPMKLRLGKHYTPTDMYRAAQLGLAEALSAGITTVHNWAHNIVGPEHADANILAHLDSGARGRFSYGWAEGQPTDKTMDLVDLARVQSEWFAGGTDGLLTLGVALRGPEVQPREHRDAYLKEFEVCRKLGLPITTHVAQHHAVTLKTQAIKRMADDRLLGPDVQLIHAIHATPEDREAMARAGSHLSLSPFTELQAGMGFPQTTEMLEAGVLVSLSIDTIAVTGADMFGTMKSLMDVENARQRKRAIEPRRLLEMATIDGARDLGIDGSVGSLVPGKRADLIMVRLDNVNMSSQAKANWPALLVRHAQPSNIDTVIVDGRILKRNGRLTALDEERIMREAAETGVALAQRAGLQAPL